ncbi:MAG: radical SAM family RiPP maturation amino acid epimerase [Pseudodesulfovibrio sp.]
MNSDIQPSTSFWPSQDARYRFAWTKRFIELLFGSLEFRTLIEEAELEKAQTYLDERGFPQQLSDFAPFFKHGPTPHPKLADCTENVLASEWVEFIEAEDSARDSFLNFDSDNHPFNLWRQRQLHRLGGEIGFGRNKQYSPIFAFELNSGCSVQCPFCAFDAAGLTSVSRYAERALLWQEILRANQKLFGECAEKACLYHATEPADTPDYFRFISDFVTEYDTLPQTTTAASLRNRDWTHQLIALRTAIPSNSDRFSLFSEEDLHQVHMAFTPDELVHVKLLTQYDQGEGDSLVRSGRNANGQKRDDDQGTIACVCGFLVNLPEKTIRLVSPCRADEDFPKGYRVHAQDSFVDAESYERVLLSMVKEFMPISLGGERTIKLRKGLKLERSKDSLSIVSRFKRYELKLNADSIVPMLELMKTGGSYKDLCDHAEKDGIPLLSFAALVDKFFKAGFLEECF